MEGKGLLKVLLVGKGAREHSLAWKLAQSSSVAHVYVVPGNGGTGSLDKVSNIRSVEAWPQTTQAWWLSQKSSGSGLWWLGPTMLSWMELRGHYQSDMYIDPAAAGIPCFAPSKEAAEIEGSKALAKRFMQKYKIPTASYQSFDSYDAAQQYLNTVDATRVVIKADGLAAGKGVILPTTQAEAKSALREIMIDAKFGPAAGRSVVIEEYLEGDEISVLTFTDGKTFKSLPPGQDHKRIFDGNKGPNTGGMGVYAPLPFVSPEVMQEIERVIIRPTLDGLRAEGRQFTGMLFTGIMLTAKGPKVLEYNARFGDPETQTMMMLLAPECDLAALLLACCTGKLDIMSLPILPGFACNVVVAAGGYPGSYRKGDIISLAPHPAGVQVFHAGTERNSDGELRTAGGRVLSVAAYGSSLEEAVSLAYRGVESVQFEGMFYRRDIASRYEPIYY
ncbi:phosphoribosylamine--glycine ligase [Canariomyces notabilis]|uniref:phosphoribosylamine--glycine ligase n=1 Tax=Canariomyces notabilis TaxID=2074819 RepID=A0AAN6T7L8_9PEZI|nr:phosphoribosylamine--glycine ligase [Canariomyces arenarius]